MPFNLPSTDDDKEEENFDYFVEENWICNLQSLF